MSSAVYSYTLPGVFDLKITGRNEGRYERYCARIGKEVESEASFVPYVEPSGLDCKKPCFYETRYFVQCHFDASITQAFVNHKMTSVCDAFDFADHTLLGTLDFVNAPGKFRFEIVWYRGGQRESAVFEWTVVSEKLDVQNDYREIVAKIEENAPGLVWAFLAKSRGEAGLVRREKTNDAIWADIFNEVGDRYRKACEWITRCPHLKYVDEVEYRRAGLVKHWTSDLVNRYAGLAEGQRCIAQFRTERIVPQIDSVENRFVKFTLEEISHRLLAFAKVCGEHKTVSETFANDLRQRAQILTRVLHRPFFRSVGRFTGFRQESLALQRKRGYAEIYATWLMLQKALDTAGRGFQTGHRPISALYEFWCFLKIDEILEHEFGFGVPDGRIERAQGYDDIFEEQDPDKIDLTTLSALTYAFPVKDGLRVKLLYQQNYGESGTNGDLAYYNPQRPDIVLVLEREDETYTYLFDAKYRIDVRNQNGAYDLDASPSEPINDMHRYRDAILYRSQADEHKLSRQIVGAYVLYPGRPHPQSYNYQELIQRENIGAIPLLPGAQGSDALKAFIGEILSKKTKDDHLGDGRVLPTRGTVVVVGSGMNVLSPENTQVIDLGFERQNFIDAVLKAWDGVAQGYVCPLEMDAEEAQKVRYIVLESPNSAKLTFTVKNFARVGTATGEELSGLNFPPSLLRANNSYQVFVLEGRKERF